MNERLKPCPFCGSENVLCLSDGDEFWLCFCSACDSVTGDYWEKNQAI